MLLCSERICLKFKVSQGIDTLKPEHLIRFKGETRLILEDINGLDAIEKALISGWAAPILEFSLSSEAKENLLPLAAPERERAVNKVFSVLRRLASRGLCNLSLKNICFTSQEVVGLVALIVETGLVERLVGPHSSVPPPAPISPPTTTHTHTRARVLFARHNAQSLQLTSPGGAARDPYSDDLHFRAFSFKPPRVN
jgi:hypothetical protein